MASFKGHIGFGFIVAVFVTGALMFYSMIEGLAVSTAIFAAIVLGSFLPDVDSDTSIVFSMIYSLVTAVVMGLSFFYIYLIYGSNLEPLLLSLAVSLVVMWLIIRPLLMKMTKHRGMFHSLPAMLISGFVGYYSTFAITGEMLLSVWFGLGLALGYLAHLILDEIHAGVNLDGTPFRPNHMLGTALKLYGGDTSDNLLTYVILIGLITITFF